MRFYVYLLIDPRDNKPFYVGKGCGRRISDHEKEAKAGRAGAKCDRIREITKAGLTVIREIESRHEDEALAYAREFELITTLDGLTNVLHRPGRPARRKKIGWLEWFLEMARDFHKAEGLTKAVIALIILKFYPDLTNRMFGDECRRVVGERADELMRFVEDNQDLFGPNGKLA